MEIIYHRIVNSFKREIFYNHAALGDRYIPEIDPSGVNVYML